ncbi:MAG TPA: SagB/ThcOx family dehydrogenase [Bacteroidales bacterium]|nr:SagB/ThcOx family dehydrogenase [Bacteroidales bacterium]HPT21081.1 SagB/ThcOx family dehydrogenase [Bacteroidales bacterium]
MKKRTLGLLFFLLSGTIMMNVTAQDIKLPSPDKKGGKPLMQALNERQSMRSFTKDNLSQQQLSDLLWAAWGINRPDDRRTAPSAMNDQEIDMYVTLPEGLYLYLAKSHSLKLIKKGDLRRLTGTQSFVGSAALNLVYVADLGKSGKSEGEKIDDSDLLLSYANTAFIAQNVYLYCASANLGCIVRGSISKDRLATEMGLRSNQKITLAQTVGVPDK